MKIRIVALAVIGMVIFSCGPKVVTPTQEVKKDEPVAVAVKKEVVSVATDKAVAVVLTAELAEGKNLYENNCAKCHKLYSPSDFSAAEWTPIVLSMQKKAKIQDAEREKIYRYLTAK